MAHFAQRRINKEIDLLRLDPRYEDINYDEGEHVLTFNFEGSEYSFTLSKDWPFVEPRVTINGKSTSLTDKVKSLTKIKDIVEDHAKYIGAINMDGGSRKSRKQRTNRRLRSSLGGARACTKYRRRSRRNRKN